MSNYTYKGAKSLSEALGIDFVELESLSDQVLDQEIFWIMENQTKIPGPKHDEETKIAIAESNKKYYQTTRGLKRKESIAERNRQLKSQEMKERWISDYENMKDRIKAGGRRKGSKDLKKRKTRTERKVEFCGVVYETAEVAAKHHYADNQYGAHYVRRMCRLNRSGWKYYD